ncbi:MAG: methyl-accepting chemotaxis protein [Clostridiales bacterium]|jgi:methyl-accepting chemotaxis protein|nr:methyl-accepting chemotaxis protein [Clostridiales bacterium]
MKSIKLRLMVVFTAIIMVITIGGGLVTTFMVRRDELQDVGVNLMEMAQAEANYVKSLRAAEKKYIGTLAQNEMFTDDNLTVQYKAAYCSAEAVRTGYLYFAFADLNGNATVFSGGGRTENVANMDFFKEAKNGGTVASDLLFLDANSDPVLIYASPVFKGSNLAGVLYGVRNGLILCDVMAEIDYKETGYAYILNSRGDMIAHKDRELVLTRDNSIETAKVDSDFEELGALTSAMIRRETGSGSYTYQGVGKIIGYAPIDGEPWVMALGIETSEVMSTVNELIYLVLAICIISAIIGAVVTFIVSSSIARPLKKITVAAKEVGEGRFDVSLSIKRKDEIGQLAGALNATILQIKDYNAYIDDIVNGLTSISDGDLTVKPIIVFKGEFEKVKIAMGKVLNGLSGLLWQIREAAEQVESGSEQVANGAQALSQGATEQASSIQQLSASINEVTSQIQETASNAKEARRKAVYMGKELRTSNDHMKNMVSAMDEITNKSSEISKIIKIIDDLAFQTNILALNAAVEAARAGASGKGFAVVADEVRNLAGKSAEAAKNIATLIAETIEAVKNGSQIADDTAQSLDLSVTITGETVEVIEKISEAADEQSTAIEQINQGVEQISAVVQTNAATAEESAAASEELSGQSNMLKDLMSRFKLRQYNAGNTAQTNEHSPALKSSKLGAASSFRESGSSKY